MLARILQKARSASAAEQEEEEEDDEQLFHKRPTSLACKLLVPWTLA
jgi:hypothetical protein